MGFRLLAAGLVALFACTDPPRSSVRVGTDVDAGSLDPRLVRDTTGYRVVDLVFDGLVRLDRDLNPVPALALRWENPEPTRWIFHLREGVRFHNGRPMTAEDVVATFESLLDAELGAPLRSLYEPIARVEAIDPHTVAFSLEEPYAPLLSYLDLGIVPRDGRGLVGTGPYRVARWDRGSRIVLETNPDFWGETPSIGAVEIVVVPDNTARAQALEAGDLDLIQSPLSPSDVSRLSRDARFRHHFESGFAMTYFNFNTRRPPLDDPRLRRAIAMLIDQETILREIYEGTDEPATSILLPSSWAYDRAIAQPGYDPEAAVALLKEAGIGDVTFALGTHSEDLNRIQTVEYLQNQLAQFGLKVELEITDWASFSLRRDASDYDLILLGWTQLVDPDKGTFDQFHSRGRLNWGGYSNPRVDELLERGRSTPDRRERVSVYRQVATIVATELPYYVLSYQGHHLFHSPRIQGFAPDPRGMLRGLASSRLAALE